MVSNNYIAKYHSLSLQKYFEIEIKLKFDLYLKRFYLTILVFFLCFFNGCEMMFSYEYDVITLLDLYEY